MAMLRHYSGIRPRGARIAKASVQVIRRWALCSRAAGDSGAGEPSSAWDALRSPEPGVELVHAALIFEHAGTGRCLENAISLVSPGGHLSVVTQSVPHQRARSRRCRSKFSCTALGQKFQRPREGAQHCPGRFPSRRLVLPPHMFCSRRDVSEMFSKRANKVAQVVEAGC